MRPSSIVVLATLAVAACRAPDPAPPASDLPSAITAAAPLGDVGTGEAITETARIGAGESGAPTTDAAPLAVSGTVEAPTDDAHPLGVAALVNLDVTNNCSPQSEPGALGLQFTLLPEDPRFAAPAPGEVTESVSDLWAGIANPLSNTLVYEDNALPPNTIIRWPTALQREKFVPYGMMTHVGYRLMGDPNHVSRVEYLFDLGNNELETVEGCIDEELSTNWALGITLGQGRGGNVPVSFSAQPQPAAGRGTFTIAQLGRRTTAPWVDVRYVTTSQDVEVAQLVEGSPLYATGVVTAHVGVAMPAGQPLATEIPWSVGDKWALVVATWREGSVDGPPYLVAYYGYPVGLRSSPVNPPDRTN
mgnify:CR=1 FL=1